MRVSTPTPFPQVSETVLGVTQRSPSVDLFQIDFHTELMDQIYSIKNHYINCYIHRPSCAFYIMLIVADEASKHAPQIQKCSCLFRNVFATF